MKTLRLLMVLSLCSLFTISCEKKDKEDPINEVIDDEVALNHFGMYVIFPKDGWGKEESQYYKEMPDSFKRECVISYLSAEKDLQGYTTSISFMRFLYDFNSKEDADKVINDLHEVYQSYVDLPTANYLSVSEIESTQISDYNASTITCVREENKTRSIEDMFLIYYNNSLYQIEILMPEDKKSEYYQDFLDIINTLRFQE
jgi:uncharacterized lipoprotein YehR (DUF1307 family)